MTNLSFQRDVIVTHVWIENIDQIPILNPSRPLPKRLKPEGVWETWIEIEKLPISIREDTYEQARIKLSNGRIINPKRNKKFPNAGYVHNG